MDFKTQIKSTVATGTAPLNVASTTVVANLNADLLDGNHASAFLTTSGNAASATKLQTARSISLSTGAVGTATNFDGTANISIPVTGISEAYLTWGGKNLSGTYAPIDAAMVPVLGANRFAFTNPAAIIVEYSRDNGATWIDYGTSDANKINLLCGNSGSIQVGGGGYAAGTDYTKYQVRLTINTSAGSIYTVLNKFVIYLSTNGSTGAWCTIDARLQSNYTGEINTWTTFADKVSVDGWSGYNVINTSGIITYGNSPASQYGQVRFTFGQTGYNVSYTGLHIMKILGFGGVGWVTPSTLAGTGLIYTYDHNKNVTFPASVVSPGFVTTIADTTGTASHYYVETSSDGIVRPKPLSNVRTEIVTTAAVNAAGATTVGTITSGVWNGTAIPVANGGTGATTAAAALTNLGLTATAAELNYTDGVTSNIQTQLNAKAASSHTHGNITNAGAIGTTADLIVKTTTSGVLTTLAAGTSGQFLSYNGTWATPPDTNTTYTAGNGLTLTGTTFDVVSAAGTAGSVGTLTVTADAVGVTLGTTSTTAAAGNHTHTANTINITDSGGYYTNTNVETVLQEIGPLIGNGITATDEIPATPIPRDADNLGGIAAVNYALLAGPTFTGTVTLPSTTSIGNVSSTEIGYLDGVTSAIQTQINAKAPLASPTFTGTVSGITAAMVGLGNVTNESKATMFTSPTFTGTPVAPTATTGTNTTQIATTAFVNAEIANDAPLKSTATGTLINYFWSGTQAQYDAIGTKDANTIYFIVG